MEEKQEHYKNILSTEDMALIGKQIVAFEGLEISFDEMEEKLQSYGITISPRFLDADKYYKGQNNSKKLIDGFKQKIEQGIVSPFDVTGYFVSCHKYVDEPNKNYDHVLVTTDRFMVELLANYQVQEAIDCLNELQSEERIESIRKN